MSVISSIDRSNWIPDVSDGISGDRYLSVDIESFVDDISHAKSPGIYVLKLSKPAHNDLEKYSRIWLQDNEVLPDYIEDVAGCEHLLYVGKSQSSVYDRIRQHIEKPNKSSTLLRKFPPHSIFDLHLFEESSKVSRVLEHNIRENLHRGIPNSYVHYR